MVAAKQLINFTSLGPTFLHTDISFASLYLLHQV
jgi:hypothetical protein